MKAPKGNGYQPEDGSYKAICITVCDLGLQEQEWDNVKSMKRQVLLRFELVENIIPSGEYEGKRACVAGWYTFSMFSGANLRRDLETWRGAPFSDEAANNFDIDTVAGKMCQVGVVKNKRGRAKVGLITPYQGDKVDPENEVIVFDTEEPHNFKSLPEWLQKMINLPTAEQQEMADEYSDYAKDYEQEQKDTANNPGPGDDFDDDIPFN